MTTDDPIFHKPKSFIAAKNLLYASLFLSMIIVIMHNVGLAIHPRFMYLGWAVAAAGYILMIFFIRQMSLCKKWARTVLTVWLGLSFLTMVISFFNPSYNRSIIEIAIWSLKTVLQIIAFIFLYGKDCENWFNSKKYEMFRQ